jgi:GNAT superfamily N-acetyltransferase
MDPVAIIPVDAFTIQGDPAIGALLAEYALEARIDGLPEPNPQWSTYNALERAGALQCFAAYIGESLVGFLALVCSENPHYGRVIGAVESWFVASAYRGSGAGMGLLKAAERMARSRGAVGMLVAARPDSRVADVLPRSGYGLGESMFFKPMGA